MIHVQKPVAVPVILTTKGAAETARLCAEYDAHRDDYRSGARTFEFDRALYGHPEVKEALCQAQHGKCAFCESRITHVMYGDVEHYRPKGGFTRRGTLMRPGYYWLAYSWDNLLLACQLCNQRHKRNAFPLAGGSRRARSHHGDVAKEAPRFVHPAKEDPAVVIGFREHVAIAIHGDARGRRTIKGLGLNRETLKGERERFLKLLVALRDIARISPQTPERSAAERLLNDATHDDAEYASMARALLNSAAGPTAGTVTTL